MGKNGTIATRTVKFEDWIGRSCRSDMVVGFMEYYDGKPFNYDTESSAYEIGRQMAIEAIRRGYKRSFVIRKVPNQNAYYWVKTKYPEIRSLLYSLGGDASRLVPVNKEGR